MPRTSVRQSRFPLIAGALLAVCVLALVCGVLLQQDRRLLQGPNTTTVSPSDAILALGSSPLSTDGEVVLVLTNSFYLVGYSEKRRNPLWAAYRLPRVPVKTDYTRYNRFMADDRTEDPVATTAFSGSGYDRGHLVPAYAMFECYGADAMIETFRMTNVSPQLPSLNRGLWRQLELLSANELSERLEEVWVITGPVFDQDVELLKSGVEVPDGFFKIFCDEVQGVPRFLAFLFPQPPGPGHALTDFLVSVDQVEALTRLDFFSRLDDGLEGTLEELWPSEIW